MLKKLTFPETFLMKKFLKLFSSGKKSIQLFRDRNQFENEKLILQHYNMAQASRRQKRTACAVAMKGYRECVRQQPMREPSCGNLAELRRAKTWHPLNLSVSPELIVTVQIDLIREEVRNFLSDMPYFVSPSLCCCSLNSHHTV